MKIENVRAIASFAGKICQVSASVSLVLAAPVAAQLWAAPPMARPTPEAADPVAVTSGLNREQAEFAERQLAENEASRRAHEQAVGAREAEMARRQAEYEAAKEMGEREHVEAMARWRADVEACKAGDQSKCAAQ